MVENLVLREASRQMCVDTKPVMIISHLPKVVKTEYNVSFILMMISSGAYFIWQAFMRKMLRPFHL